MQDGVQQKKSGSIGSVPISPPWAHRALRRDRLELGGRKLVDPMLERAQAKLRESEGGQGGMRLGAEA